MRILVTGGVGYIGSHTAVCLLEAGHEVVILDNLSNSRPSTVDAIGRITGRAPLFIEGDVCRRDDILHAAHVLDGMDAVLHFAGLKAVGESVEQPLAYYDCNVAGALSLLRAMLEIDCKTLVFSSSASIYGNPPHVPIREDCPISPTNPYGAGKAMIEQMLADVYAADPSWSIARLRYFNPVGAHDSALIGELPRGAPSNLVPRMAQTAVGLYPKLLVYGNDYPTRDGTGVRDYIHVMDLAEAHMAALTYLQDKGGLLTVNLGTGQGYSVLEVIEAFSSVNGIAVPYQVTARRTGDTAECYADPALAHRLLGWKATRGLKEMCQSAWQWQQRFRTVGCS